jgi:hypothetical protein
MYFIFFLLSFCFAEAQEYIIGSPDDGSIMPATKQLISESYESLGYSVKFENLPPERALSSLESGQTDAELIRMEFVEKPEKIIRVNVALAKHKFFVFLKKSKNNKNISLHELKKKRGAIILGYKVTEKLLADVKSVEKVPTAKQLIQLLRSGRIDYAISPSPFIDVKSEFYQYVIISHNVYHMVSHKNKEIIPLLEQEFKKRLTPQVKDKIQSELDVPFEE